MVQTLVLDRRFRGVGRIKRASGTTKEKLHAKINAMLTDLYQTGRLDILLAIQSGELAPMEVWVAYHGKDLGSLPLGDALKPLHVEYEAWRKRTSKSEKHALSRAQSGRYLKEYGRAEDRVAAIPTILLAAKKAMETKGHNITFNLLKSAAQAFVRDTMGKGSALYLELLGIPRLDDSTRIERRPQRVAELDAATDEKKMDVATAAACWSMATTGMGPDEYWGDWTEYQTHIHIEGTKRKARVRDVPNLGLCNRPLLSRQAFEDRLVKCGAPFKPYDMRRTFANWMEAAKIDRTRRRLYLGHKEQDVTDRYESHAINPYLVQDGETLRAYIEAQRAKEQKQ